jgi:4-amino-4-deoxy-L-arabinose transferase-like glycosyltransferase
VRLHPQTELVSSETEERRLSRPIVLLTILGVALSVRLAWMIWTVPTPLWLSDEQFYNAAALSIARGHGYSVIFDANGWRPGGDATAFWPPAYSAFLAAVYTLFGEHLAVARVANVVAGACVIVPVYFIGVQLFDERAAIAGAAIAALSPSLIFWTPVLLSETLFTFLFACVVALLLDSVDNEGHLNGTRAVLTGVLIGATALVRGEIFVLLLVAPLWWTLMGVAWIRSLRLTLVMASAALVCVAPWLARNVVVFDSPVLATNLGYDLRVGNAPYATGRYVLPQDLWAADPPTTFTEHETVFNDLGRRRAVSYALSHPGRELELAVRKIEWLWRPDSDVLTHVSSNGLTPLPSGAVAPLRLLIDVAYVLLVGLAAAALVRIKTSGTRLVLPWLIVLVWSALHVAFFGEPRYHLPLLAVMSPMAGATVVWLSESLASGLAQRMEPAE